MRKRKFLSAALVAAMVLTTTVQTDLAWADVVTEETMQNVTDEGNNDVRRGKCGENLTWKLVNGTLTISGSGEMDDFALSDYLPWGSLKDDIGKVIIEEGVTYIGESAFEDCIGLTSIEIPEGVTSIGEKAFYGCSGLTSIEIPEGVTSIEGYAFSGCIGLTSIEIPSSVTSIGGMHFPAVVA